MDCTCNYSEPVYVASTKSGDVLQIYDSVESSENVSEWAKDNFVCAVDARGADDPNVQIRESVDICEQKSKLQLFVRFSTIMICIRFLPSGLVVNIQC